MLTPATIWSIVNTILLTGIIIFLYFFLNSHNIKNYIKQTFKESKDNLHQDLINSFNFIKEDYQSHQNKITKVLKEQQTEIEKLKKIIEAETLAFKKYCQDRINIQEKIVNETEKKLQNLQKELYKTQNMLSKCKKKLVNKGIKNDDENS